MDAPLTTTRGLKAGDVLQVAVQLTDKQTGQPYWWRRFVCVMAGPRSSNTFRALTLKMHPDEKDLRELDLRDDKQVVTQVPETSWPQGVVAMRMKLLMNRTIKLDEG